MTENNDHKCISAGTTLEDVAQKFEKPTEGTFPDGADGIDEESKLLTGWKLAACFASGFFSNPSLRASLRHGCSGMLLSIFLVALDQSIVATAIPRIASEFNALSQISWITSAYFLTRAGLLLTYGQFLTVAPPKWIFLAAIFLFELGSLFCGVAPSINFLIFGRAVAGTGAAGLFISVLTVIAVVTRLEDRPILFGLFGAVFALSSVAGPLVGGAFTDHITWRWCFYINLPIGAISSMCVVFLLKKEWPRELPHQKGKATFQKWLNLDWVGTALCLGLVTCLSLALQWGGNEKPWGSAAVIICFAVFGAFLPVFIIWEKRRGDNAIMPVYFFKNTTQVGCSLEMFFIFLGLLVGTYYLPLWYQATRGHSATKSGIDILAFQISTVVGSSSSGAIINRTGRYWSFLFVSPLIFSVAGGLLFTAGIDTSTAKLIGYQILLGIGIGGALQNAVIAIQAEYAPSPQLIPQTTSLVSFTQLLGGIIGIAIAEAIFANQLTKNLAILAPDLPAEIAESVRSAVTVIYSPSFPQQFKAQVIQSYVKSLDPIFLVVVPSGAIAAASSFLIKNRNLKNPAKDSPAA